MEKILILIKEIKEASSNEIINTKIAQLVEEINIVLAHIRSCRDVDEAASYFALLEDVQGQISLLISKNELELPSSLWKLYADFDRIDDSWWRGYIFNKIKTENYSLEGKSAMDE